jgi:hypothetical protein
MATEKRQGSFRLSDDAWFILERLKSALGISQTDVVEIALREKWKSLQSDGGLAALTPSPHRKRSSS